MTLIPAMAQAQFAGWPSSSTDPEIDATVKTVTSKEYLDVNRARVTAATLVSSSPLRYDLTVSAPSSSSLAALSFPVNKWCLMIQMEDNVNGTVGTHTRAVVVSYNSGTATLRVEIPGSMPTFDYAASSRIQIIRVPVYWNMYLNPGGELTCSEYNHDDGTGGVAPVVVGNSAYFNGGIINAASKGYHYSWAASPDLGQGGAGALGSTSYMSNNLGEPGGPPAHPVVSTAVGGNPPGISTIDGGMQPPSTTTKLSNTVYTGYLCHANPSPLTSPTGISKSNNPGLNGDGQVITYGSGSSTNMTDVLHFEPSTPTASTPWSVLRMGNSGNPGTNGGHGGGGGGHGGTGGDITDMSNGANHLGAAGTVGQDGQSGGNAGEGARGGGIVLLKIASYSRASNVTSTRKMIFVDGGNGDHGTKGGDGGDGGAGGDGADGRCEAMGSNIIPPGGRGGFGESGIGAQGGDGGNGGQCGTVWIMKKGTGFSFSGHVSIRGGLGGGGGTGGYSLRYIDLPLANNYVGGSITSLPCNVNNWDFCAPVGPPLPDIEICDCDKVFTHIVDDLRNLSLVTNHGGTLPSIAGSPWQITGSGYSVYFDDDHNFQPVLYYIDPTLPRNTRYNCYMYRQDQYLTMMKKLFQVDDLMTFVPNSGTTYNVGCNTTNYNGSLIQLRYYDAGNSTSWHNFTYTPGGSNGKLQDLDDPNEPIVYAGNCSYSFRSGSYGGGGSGSGEFQPPVVTYLEKTGADGNQGNDEPDGNVPDNFNEGDNAPRLVPEDDGSKTRNGLNEVTDLVNVISTQDGKTKKVTLKDADSGEASYKIYTLTGQVIKEGKFTNELIFTEVASGYYILEVKVGTSIDRRKILLGSN